MVRECSWRILTNKPLVLILNPVILNPVKTTCHILLKCHLRLRFAVITSLCVCQPKVLYFLISLKRTISPIYLILCLVISLSYKLVDPHYVSVSTFRLRPT
jgi:hypothetical protein